jgi:hypothetical protein
MHRSVLVLTLVAACGSSPPAPAPAPRSTEPEVAAALNDQGKAAMYAGDIPSAQRLFRAAVARDPQSRYLFNLCIADFQTGAFGDALTSCRAARTTAAPEQLDKIDKLVVRIRDEAARQNVALP